MKTKFLSTTAKKAKRGRKRANITKSNEQLPKLPKKPPLILNVGKLLKKKEEVKKRGRPVGSKNKSTGRKAPPGGFKSSEFIDPKDDEDVPKKRGRGRPKGAKNKAKKDDMSDISAGFEAGLAKRGRGRPKGAKNKERVRGDTTNQNAPSFKSFMDNKKGEASDADIAKYSKPSIKDRLGKRKRGRPVGSKNKAKDGITHSKFKGEASDADIAKYSKPSIKDRLGKRKVGRPKGGGVFKGGDEFGKFEKKERKVRSDKGVKRGKRTKVI